MEKHELEDLGEQYLCDKKLSQRTLKTYRGALKLYVNYLKKQGILYAKTADVIKYRAYRRSLGHSSDYIYIHFSFLKGFYRYLKINAQRLNVSDHYLFDIMAPIKNEKIYHHIDKRILSPLEAKKIIMTTKEKRQKMTEYRDHAIIFLMLTTGMRPYEILHAKKANYKEVEEMMLLYIEKNNSFDETSFVKISKGTKQAIDDYLKFRDDDNPYLFISQRHKKDKRGLSEAFFQHMFHKLMITCGFQGLKITPHVLTHTAAIINLKRGGSLASTKVLMRHQSIRSTIVYEDYLYHLYDHSSEALAAFILKEDMWDFLDEL